MMTEEEENQGTKRSGRKETVQNVRLRVRRAMQQEEIVSDESDEDFGFDQEYVEDEDVELKSEEIDSASEDAEGEKKPEETQDGEKKR